MPKKSTSKTATKSVTKRPTTKTTKTATSTARAKTSTKTSAKKVAAKKSTQTVRTAAPKRASKATKTAKATASKATNAAKARRPGKPELVQANPEHAFWATNGEVMANLAELRDALGRMESAVFAAHVSKEKNDFAEWVEHVLGDAKCAAALRRATQPQKAHTVVVRFVKQYNV